jgi:hypothetical protein
VIIELQKASFNVDMMDRCVGHVARDYSEQWRKGKVTESRRSEYSLIPVLSVAILNWTFDTEESLTKSLRKQSLVQRYVCTLKDAEPTPRVETRMQRLADYTYIQLPLAPKTVTESCSDIEKWAILLRDSQFFSNDDIPEIYQREPFRTVVESARWDALSDEDCALVMKEQDKAHAVKLVIDELHAAISERDAAISEKDAAISERDAAISEKDAAISEKDAAISEKDAAISEKDAAISEKDAIISEKVIEYEILRQKLRKLGL